jgi:hypothetical protein
MRKLHVNQIANGAAVVADTAYTFNAEFHEARSVHIIWTSTTASATVALQFSNDGGTTWENFAAAQAISNNNGSVFHKVAGNTDAFSWRVYLDWTSGTLTTLKAYVAYLPR